MEKWLLQINLGLSVAFPISWLMHYSISHEIVPYRNNLIYSAALAIALVATAIAWSVFLKMKPTKIQIVKKGTPSAPAWVGKLFIAVSLVFGLIFIFNVNSLLTAPNFDPFHEGEYLGYLAGVLSHRGPLFLPFTNHGFGPDIFPTLFGHFWGNGENTIILARSFRHIFGIIACLGMLWAAWEISGLERGTQRLATFSLFCWALIGLHNYTYSFSSINGLHAPIRQAMFIWQIAFFIRLFLGDLETRSLKPAMLIFFGGLLPVSIIFCSSYGVTFLAAFILSSGVACINRPAIRTRLQWVAVGAVLSGLVLLSVMGYQFLYFTFDGILRLARYGKALQRSEPIGFGYFLFGGAVQALFLVNEYWIALRKKTSFISVSNGYVVLLGLYWIFYLHLDYGMHAIEHYMWVSWTATLILFFYLGAFFKSHAKNPIWKVGFALAVIPFVLVSNNTLLSPRDAFHKIRAVVSAARIKDSALIPTEYQDVKQAISAFLPSAPCIFVTDDNYLILYYVLNKPSCSRYYSPEAASRFHDNEFLRTQIQGTTNAIVIRTTTENSTRWGLPEVLHEFKEIGRSGKFILLKN